MSFEPVDIFVLEDTPTRDPVPGVLVKVYDETGTIFFTQATTDESGRAEFLLETLNYSLRFYKFNTGFTQPQMIVVLAAPEANQFNVSAEVFSHPLALDARLCRASGFFRDLNGSAKKFLDIHFASRFRPILLEGAGVITERVHIRTDEDGYAQVDLIRGGEYLATIEAFEDAPRLVQVPDTSSVNLPDLLFPVVDRIELDPTGPYSIAVDGEIEVTPTVLTSSLLELEGTARSDVIWKSSDSTVLIVSATKDKIILRGVSAGTAQLLALRRDETIIRIPEPGIEGQPVTVIVT